MSWLSALIGAGGDLVGGYLNYGYSSALQSDAQWYNYWTSKQAADTAYNRQRQLIQDNAYLQRQGLEKAGYNPLLAVSNGFHSASPSVQSFAPSSPTGSVSPSSLGSSAVANYLKSKEIKSASELRDAQVATAKKDVEQKDAQIKLIDAERQKSLAQASEVLQSAKAQERVNQYYEQNPGETGRSERSKSVKGHIMPDLNSAIDAGHRFSSWVSDLFQSFRDNGSPEPPVIQLDDGQHKGVDVRPVVPARMIHETHHNSKKSNRRHN